MNPNIPSLILYFVSIVLNVVLKLLGYDDWAIYANAVGMPLIFIYFFITNNYKIDIFQAIIFLFCFIAEVINLINPIYSKTTQVVPYLSVILYLIVNCLMIFYVISKENKTIKLRKNSYYVIVIVTSIIAFLFFKVLKLKFYPENYFFPLYVIYGFILGILSSIVYSIYIIKPSYIHLFLVLMVTCTITSDIFFIFNSCISNIISLVLIRDIAQVLSHFFMVKYFLELLKPKIQLNDY